MPDGKTHAVATIAVSVVVSPFVVLIAHQPVFHAAAFGVGCLAGLVMNPDLDVQIGSRAYVIMRQIGGNIIGKLWRLFWYPYAKWLIPYHRHPLSHLPVMGTLIRIAYLLIVPSIIWWVLSRFVSLPSLPQITFTVPLQWAVVGLILVDAVHSLMDWTWKS